jgi:signal peptidase I
VLSLSGSALLELLQAVLEKEVPFRFRAKGLSMSPFIKDGDVVTVSPMSHATPRLGDVLAHIDPRTQKLVVHRVVGEEQDFVRLKGDNNVEAGDRVFEKDILGCVKKVERNGQQVFLGLGPERRIISFLSRKMLLPTLLSIYRLFVRPLSGIFRS